MTTTTTTNNKLRLHTSCIPIFIGIVFVLFSLLSVSLTHAQAQIKNTIVECSHPINQTTPCCTNAELLVRPCSLSQQIQFEPPSVQFTPPNTHYSPPREIHVLNQTLKFLLPTMVPVPTNMTPVPPVVTTVPIPPPENAGAGAPGFPFPPAPPATVQKCVNDHGVPVCSLVLPNITAANNLPPTASIRSNTTASLPPVLPPPPNVFPPTSLPIELQTLQTLQKSQELQQSNAQTLSLKLDVISKQLSMLDDDLHNLTLALQNQNHTR